MLEYAISFYNNFTILFYLIITIAVILEWPIVILTLILVSSKLGLPFYTIFILAFIWDFWWDLIHFLVWKFTKNFFLKKKKFQKIENLNKKIEKLSLIEKLLIIKFTPPITIIWLVYLWASKISLFELIKKDFFICIFSSTLIVLIWTKFWEYFKNSDNLALFLFLIWFAIFLLTFITKLIWKFLIKKIYEKNSIK